MIICSYNIVRIKMFETFLFDIVSNDAMMNLLQPAFILGSCLLVPNILPCPQQSSVVALKG